MSIHDADLATRLIDTAKEHAQASLASIQPQVGDIVTLPGCVEITAPDAVSIRQASEILPRNKAGTRVTVSTILRWLQKGVGAKDGSRIKLQGARIGNSWITTRSALERFTQAMVNRNRAVAADRVAESGV